MVGVFGWDNGLPNVSRHKENPILSIVIIQWKPSYKIANGSRKGHKRVKTTHRESRKACVNNDATGAKCIVCDTGLVCFVIHLWGYVTNV